MPLGGDIRKECTPGRAREKRSFNPSLIDVILHFFFYRYAQASEEQDDNVGSIPDTRHGMN